MLTVSELIEKLKTYPMNMPVIVVDDREGGGYNHTHGIERIKVSALASGCGPYYGELMDYEAEKADTKIKKADQEIPVFKEHFDAMLIK